MTSLDSPLPETKHDTINPQVIGFILYCTRQKNEWPDLYDEMCRVAGQGLYQGLHHKDLRNLGFSLSLNRIENAVQTIEVVTNSRIGHKPFS
jgi:hypothetical protein